MMLFFSFLVETLIAVLTGSLALFAALHARAFIALALTNLSDDTGLGTASLETLESAIQRFAFLNMNFGHLCFPSLRYTRLIPWCSLRVIYMTNGGIIWDNCGLVNIFFTFSATILNFFYCGLTIRLTSLFLTKITLTICIPSMLLATRSFSLAAVTTVS